MTEGSREENIKQALVIACRNRWSICIYFDVFRQAYDRDKLHQLDDDSPVSLEFSLRSSR